MTSNEEAIGFHKMPNQIPGQIYEKTGSWRKSSAAGGLEVQLCGVDGHKSFLSFVLQVLGCLGDLLGLRNNYHKAASSHSDHIAQSPLPDTIGSLRQDQVHTWESPSGSRFPQGPHSIFAQHRRGSAAGHGSRAPRR